MIPSATIVEVEGTIPGEKVGMGFDPNSIAHIITVLTDLYSDPVGAVVREYATNAWDAHVEAGVTDPIEVFTPSPLSPCFRVVDHGVGLSLDDIRSIYSMYGASTKRGTNTQNGMLGLGSKSALTLTNQFTVDAKKDGKRTLVSVSRQPDGTGEMTVVSHGDTDEGNGVEITIPGAGSSFLATATKFFSYWPEDRYLLNGGTVPSATEDLEEISPGVFVNIGLNIGLKNGYSNLQQSKIVMGGVAYPIDSNKHSTDVPYIAYVPIGAVNFTPNREALHYTEKTMKVLEEIAEKVRAGLTTHIQKVIDSCESPYQAFLYNKSITRMFSFIHLTYKGLSIPTSIQIDEYTPGTSIQSMTVTYRGNDSYSYDVKSTVTRLYPNNDGFVFIVGDDVITPGKRIKIRKWMRLNQISLQTTILYSPVPPEQLTFFLQGIKTYKWEDIKTSIPVEASTKLPRSITMFGKRFNAKGDPWVKTEQIFDTSDIDTSKDVVHFSPTEGITDAFIQSVVKMFDCVLLQISAGSFNKFSREFKSTHINDYANKKIAELGGPTESDLINLSLSSRSNSWYNYYDINESSLDSSHILDPEVRKWIDARRVELTPAAKAIRHFGLRFDELKDPLREYPLLGKCSSWGGWSVTDTQDSIIYMNAKYNLKDNND